jgi:hypothetical protein
MPARLAGSVALAAGLLLACSTPSRPADAPAGFVNRVWKVSQSSFKARIHNPGEPVEITLVPADGGPR